MWVGGCKYVVNINRSCLSAHANTPSWSSGCLMRQVSLFMTYSS